jgi:hypothetical protein
MFGSGQRFKAYVAHYPVCYAANKVIAALPLPAQFGTQYLNPTGAPVLIQLGGLDDRDNGAWHCRTVAPRCVWSSTRARCMRSTA